MAHVWPVGGEKPLVCFDLDGVAADLVSKWLAHYNRDWDDNLTPDDIVAWNWDSLVKPECGKRIYHYLSRPGFFADLAPLPGAIEALRQLNEQAELVVLSASPQTALRDKWRWVEKHVPFLKRRNIILTYRKDLVRADLHIDDAPKNLTRFAGIRALFDYRYNRNFHDAWRLRGWQEFLPWFAEVVAGGPSYSCWPDGPALRDLVSPLPQVAAAPPPDAKPPPPVH